MRYPLSGLAAALLAAVALVSSSRAVEPAEAPRSYDRANAVVRAVRKTKAAVVTVRVPRPGGGKDLIGTGVFVDERGYLVTNRHVVGANRKVIVTLHDGTDLFAEVVAAEARCDLAVLRVRTKRVLTALRLGPHDDLMVGEDVIAIGHPFGYGYTVTKGNVSALGRVITMPDGESLRGLIQHSASINPGNSGGPLLNINGELIGINVALREGAQGIAFALNTGTVEDLLSRHLNAQRVAGVDHGLRCTEKVIAETGDRQRVVVADVARAAAPLRPGDVIRAVGALRVANVFDVERALWDKRPGQTVELRVVRAGRELTVTLTLRAGRDEPIAALRVPPMPDAAVTVRGAGDGGAR